MTLRWHSLKQPFSVGLQVQTDLNILNWLDDDYIDKYFQCFSKSISLLRKYILLVNPNTTQIIKNLSTASILETLTYLSFESYNISLFCLNNCNDTIDLNSDISNFRKVAGRTHWSLLIFLRKKQNMLPPRQYQLGLNKKHVEMLANNICYCCQIEEINTPQQVSNFECGVHVIVNTKLILDHCTQTIANYNLF